MCPIALMNLWGQHNQTELLVEYRWNKDVQARGNRKYREMNLPLGNTLRAIHPRGRVEEHSMMMKRCWEVYGIRDMNQQ